jgi:pyruvate/2-oxoglutarate dehydrogenase complex dihydrolipoamide acyltransferase (E2) component
MGFITTRKLMVLSSGFVRGPNEPIGQGELEPDVFNALLADGSIVDISTINATEKAIQLAESLAIDITGIRGTGQGGRILVSDVRRHAEGE